MIWTVLGQVKPRELGVCLMHEHLVPREAVPQQDELERFVLPCDTEAVVRQLVQAKRFGLQSVVDVTPSGPDRDPLVLREIAQQTDLNIICATGFYKEPRVPAFVYGMSVPEIAEFMCRELVEEIGDSGIKAGIIKVGTSKNHISSVEQRILRAAAVAHKRTGAPITTHATLGTMGVEQLRILEREGVDPNRVVIGHSDLNTSPVYHGMIAKRGAFLGFDTIGKERFDYVRVESAGVDRYEFLKEHYHITDQRRLEALLALIVEGFGSQIVLSSDIVRLEAYMNPRTLGSLGYSYLLSSFLSRVPGYGVDDVLINRLLISNPKTVFER